MENYNICFGYVVKGLEINIISNGFLKMSTRQSDEERVSKAYFYNKWQCEVKCNAINMRFDPC